MSVGVLAYEAAPGLIEDWPYWEKCLRQQRWSWTHRRERKAARAMRKTPMTVPANWPAVRTCHWEEMKQASMVYLRVPTRQPDTWTQKTGRTSSKAC